VFLDKGANTLLIELDRVQTHHGWEPFYARLVSVSGAQIEKSASGELAQPDIPGAAKIVLTGGLAAGTRMVWKTELLAAPKDAGTPQLGTSMEMR
jgi:hypothetical protein